MDIERVFRVGDLALTASNEQSSIHRCVTVFDVSKPGSRKVPHTDGLTGEFVTSYYLSTLIKHDTSENRADDFVVHGNEHKIPGHKWPKLAVWLRDMTR
jgi:hypothetical protein